MAEELRRTRVERAGDWRVALAGGLGGGAAGFLVAQWFEMGLGLSLGVGGLLSAAAVVGTYLSFRAGCPSCGAVQRFSNVAVEDGEGRTVRGLRDGYVLCLGCKRYSRHVGDELVELEADHLADRPVFEVRGSDLGRYSPEAPAPEICCACGGTAVGAETYPLLVSSQEVAFGAMVQVQKAQVELGHCGEHEDAAGGDGYVIWLRSYPVWRGITKS